MFDVELKLLDGLCWLRLLLGLSLLMIIVREPSLVCNDAEEREICLTGLKVFFWLSSGLPLPI